MLLCSAEAGVDGKILNSLDHPLWNGPLPPKSLASDLYCYQQDVREKGEKYPLDTMRWGLAATAGAYHHWHIDVNGMATWFLIRCGVKIIIIAREKAPGDFSSPTLFKGMNLISAKQDKWDVEAVVLRPGDYM